MPAPSGKKPSRKRRVNRAKPTPAMSARETRMLGESKRSAASRRKNILSATPSARIKGHAKGAYKAARAKRDARPRGEE